MHSKIRYLSRVTTLITLIVIVAGLCLDTFAQKRMSSVERGSMKTMLSVIKDNIEDNYYDPKFKGIDLDSRFEQAKQKVGTANTVAQAFAVIAQVLIDFDDSHLFFLPPATNLDVEYGYRTRMIGDKCIVITVKPKSDAAKKGLRKGDQLLQIEGFRPSRRDMWKIDYLFNTLSKRSRLRLVVLKPGTEEPKSLTVAAKVKKKSRVITRETIYQLFDPDAKTQSEQNIFIQLGNTTYWKLPSFSISPGDINRLVDRIGDANNLILDLRGNSGGAVSALERLAGFMFDKEMVIATPKGRKEFDEMKGKPEGGDVFKGRLIVLIDSASASAAEIFARTVQLEERGVVIGDISSGSVMMSRQLVNSMRNDAIFYGVSVTVADVIMPDGKSLEHTGVMPNARIVPTAVDISQGRDPVLAEAFKLFGSEISPAKAGALFTVEWRKDGSVITLPAKSRSE